MALPRETNEDISLLLEVWWNNGGQMITVSLVAPIPAGLRWKPNLSLPRFFQHMEWFEEEGEKTLPFVLFDPLPDLD